MDMIGRLRLMVELQKMVSLRTRTISVGGGAATYSSQRNFVFDSFFSIMLWRRRRRYLASRVGRSNYFQ